MNAQTTLNPFSSRFVSPLTSNYLQHENDQTELDQAIRQIRESKFLQIVGKHGCGKTMTAIEIARRLDQVCRAVRLVTIQPGTGWLGLKVVFYRLDDQKVGHHAGTQRPPTKVTIVDGMEQLNFVGKIGLIHSLQCRSSYVIVTTHRPIWFLRKQMYVRPTLERFRQIAARLTHDTSFQPDDELFSRVYLQSQGNYRSALSLLYDEFQQSELQRN